MSPRIERDLREFLSDWHFWVGVAYVGLAAVTVALYALYGRTAHEEAIRAATTRAAASTQVGQCFTSVKNGPLTRGFIDAQEAIIDNGLLGNRAAIDAQPDSPLTTVRINSIKRLMAAKRNANTLRALVNRTTSTTEKCIALAAKLGVDDSSYLPKKPSFRVGNVSAEDHEPLSTGAFPGAATGRCGVERWAVKTLTDPEALTVNLTPVLTTVPHLVGLTNTGTAVRQAPTETTTFQLTGVRLVAFKLEGDSDVHLVLRSVIAPFPTMIAEIPDPACSGNSIVLTQIKAARAAFLAALASHNLTLSSSFQTVDWPLLLRGVGFFDFPHGQTGLAANDIELHPVIYFQTLKGA